MIPTDTSLVKVPDVAYKAAPISVFALLAILAFIVGAVWAYRRWRRIKRAQ